MKKFLITILLLLNACGVKGDLYMPPKKTKTPINFQSLNCPFCIQSHWENTIISL